MTTINVRQKGAEGEREVAKALNAVILRALNEQGHNVPDTDIVQRNQNQTAVGGNDLSNVFGLSVEVKRQEQLAINAWWAQCVAAAARNAETPVLIYRQNRKAWRVVMNAELPLPMAQGSYRAAKVCRVELSWDDFLEWFYQHVTRKLLNGYEVRV